MSKLREKCSYSEFFRSVFPRIRTENWEILCIFLYSVQMWENTDRKNSEYGHLSRYAYQAKIFLVNIIPQGLTPSNYLKICHCDVSGWKPLTIFAKSFVINVWQAPQNTPVVNNLKIGFTATDSITCSSGKWKTKLEDTLGGFKTQPQISDFLVSGMCLW